MAKKSQRLDAVKPSSIKKSQAKWFQIHIPWLFLFSILLSETRLRTSGNFLQFLE
jgi:hypothetical protein